MKILFVDDVCPRPYEVTSLDTMPMGGTEATCARLIRELSKQDTIFMSQQKRTEEHVDSLGISYLKADTLVDSPDAVITLRDARTFRIVNERYPKAKHYLWMHDVVSGPYLEHLQQCIVDFPTTMLAGSLWHKMQIAGQLPDQFNKGLLKIEQVTNFVEHYCDRTSDRSFDPYKLSFFSSPHKGLERVLTLFTELHKRESKYQLYISNPGYFANREDLPEGVVQLGVLSHKDAIESIRTSLCTFYPNNTFPETFGLVYAESNAVGTPVLCHDIGAAKEIITTPQQMVSEDPEVVYKTVMDWTAGLRPVVKVKEQYTIGEAIRDWRKMLNPMRLLK